MDQPRNRHVPNTMMKRHAWLWVGVARPHLRRWSVSDHRLRRRCPLRLRLRPSATRAMRGCPLGAVALGDPCDSTGGGPPPSPITLLEG